MCNRKGFTLIELLVVIAIIAILAAIVFPVFFQAKRNAHVSACINNQKQWGMAMLMYIGDNSGGFPWAGTANAWPHSLTPPPRGQGGKCTVCWQALWPYTGKNKGILFCPLWKSSTMYRDGWRVDWTYWYFCAHTNPYVAANPLSALCGYKLSDVRTPSWKPCLTEINAPHDNDRSDSNGAKIVGQTQCYCDGHAKCVYGTWPEIYKLGYRSRLGPP